MCTNSYKADPKYQKSKPKWQKDSFKIKAFDTNGKPIAGAKFYLDDSGEGGLYFVIAYRHINHVLSYV